MPLVCIKVGENNEIDGRARFFFSITCIILIWPPFTHCLKEIPFFHYYAFGIPFCV